jgi:hypothetical protein
VRSIWSSECRKARLCVEAVAHRRTRDSSRGIKMNDPKNINATPNNCGCAAQKWWWVVIVVVVVVVSWGKCMQRVSNV